MDNKSIKSIRLKKIIASVALFFLVFQLFVPALVYPQPASAQFGAPLNILSNIWDTIWKYAQKGLKIVADVAFKNILKTFLNKAAYDAAVYIASGGKGQKPMFLTKEIGTYLKDIADSAYGNYLDKLSKDVWGRSLCDTDPIIKIKFNTWAIKVREPPEPAALRGKCTITKIGESIKKTTQGQLADFSTRFNPEANDFGAFLSITAGARKVAQEKQREKELERLITGESDPLKSIITGESKTPAYMTKKVYERTWDESFSAYKAYTGTAVADAVGIFTNTLVAKLMKQVFEKGVNPELSTSVGAKFVTGGTPGIAAAKMLFASLAQPDYATGGEVNIIDSLSSCPDRENPLPDTCVIDSRFRTAIEEKITVQQAIDRGLLDASKTVGYDVNGLEPNYLNGYPYRSLVILRKFRVLPVGWELAAKYIKQYSPGNYSLGSLIDDYDNEESPFYHLVDPNWVLKAPAVFCKRQGASEKVVYEQVIRGEDTSGDGSIDTNDVGTTLLQRQDYCADEQTCILEADDGSCRKYGYCIEEDPIWRFNATSCDSQYNTCQSFANREGNSVSYLKNSVDYNNCSSNNVGCQWYCQDWSVNTSQWTCTSQVPPAGGNKISFNYQTETCSPTDDGCHKYMTFKGTGANVLVNSDFELYERTINGGLLTDGMANTDRPDNFYGWWGGGNTVMPPPGTQCFGGPDDGDTGCTVDDDCAEEGVCTTQGGWCGDRLYASTQSYEGNTTARISYIGVNCSAGDPGHYTIQTIDTGHLTNNRTFTVSFYTRLDPDDSVDCVADPGQVSFQLMRVIDDSVSPPVADSLPSSLVSTITNNWTRYTRTFTFGVPTDDWGGADIDKNQREIYLYFRRQDMGSGGSCDILIDNVKVEEGSLTDYNPYQENQETYLKKPPEYLGCTDNLNANDPVCDGYALYCSEDEVGCQQYTSSSGDVVNGIVTDPAICDYNDPASCDQCPMDYVGCKAFKELATENMPIRPERDPVSFVPASGNSCPASAVGCEEYTNLDEVALSGEGREYYSLIRQCVEADDAEATTYYTWEGSDEFGYQLKNYHLKTTNIAGSNAPCTNINPEPDGWPACNDSNDPDDLNYWADCSDTCDGATNTCTNNARVSCEADIDCIRANYDCREFYDSAGDTSYRLKSRVIYAAEECTPYRNSIDGASKTYHMIPGQGIVCGAEYAGCRAYKGNAGDNIRTVYSEQFENGSVAPWTGDVSYSNESIHQGGHSMLVAGTPQSIARVNEAGNDLGLQSDRSYIFSFWAKGAGSNSNVTVGFTGFLFPGTANVPADDWNLFSLGPFYIPADLVVELRPLDIIGSSAFYIDNIVIEEITDNIYYIKDSYTDCSGWENCDAYTDSYGNINYLKSFTRLCSEEKIGCQALLDTQNSRSPFATTYPLADGVDGTIPADTTVTMVVDSEKSCAVTEKGCQRLGLPSTDVDGLVSGYEDSMLKNDPDKYNQILCKYEHSGCEEYTTADDQKFYFKDPGTKTCLYQKVGGQDAYGWYKQGTTTGPPDCPVSTGWCTATSPNAYDRCNSDDDCGVGGACGQNDNVVRQPVDGWVGLCSESISGCTEIVDPEDPVDPLDQICDITVPGNCKSYYYLSQELDQSSCNGIVDREEGCRLLYDTSDSILNYNTDTTEDGHTPALCITPGVMGEASGDCNANAVLQVVKDRVCGTWLECVSSWRVTDAKGNVQDLCLDQMACNQIDEQTGQCINPIDLSKINETYNTPVFVDEIKNYSGMVLAGLDWDRRCDNSGKPCNSDGDCDGGTCQAAQIIEGYFPFSAMEQVGLSGASEDDLIPNGDFFDSDYANNFQLSQHLSCLSGQPDCAFPPDPPDIGDASTGEDWTAMVGAVISLVEEGVNDWGNSFNVDENNILAIDDNDSGPWWGTRVRFSGGASANDVYTLSYKLKREFIPEDSGDYVNAYLGWTETAPVTVAHEREDDITTLHPRGHTFELVHQARVDGQPVGDAWQEFATRVDVAKELEDYLVAVNNEVRCACPGNTCYPVWVQQSACYPAVTLDQIIAEFETAENYNFRWQTREFGTPPGPSDVDFFLDNVSLKPALEVQNPPDPATLIARSCRMYPKTDASLCSYTDENLITYKGWQGYCLERDPQYPQYCINWWPVDLIAGETNIFGQTGEGVGYAGRRPLYYCMEAEGNFPYLVSPRHSIYGWSGQGWGGYCVNTWAHDDRDPDEYNRGVDDDIESCPEIGSDGDWALHDCSGRSGYGDFTIGACGRGNPHHEFTWDIPATAPEYHLSEYAIEKVRVTEKIDGSEYPHEFELTRVSRVIEGGVVKWRFSQQGVGGTTNEIQFDLIFNNDLFLSQYYIYVDDFTGADNEGVAYKVDFYLKEPCKAMVKVADTGGEPRVWADRIQSSSYQVNQLGYQLSTDYKPYGGTVNPLSDNSCLLADFDDPTTWCKPLFVEQREVIQGENWARAGSPYSCAGDCSGRMCQGNETNSCSDNDFINTCINTLGSYCVGLGGTAGSEASNKPIDPYSRDRQMRLFAKPIESWVWEDSAQAYQQDDIYTGVAWWNSSYDTMSICLGNPPSRPSDFASEYCGVPPSATLTLGVGGETRDSGFINLGSGGTVQLNLTMRADKEQLPITNYWIEWGDNEYSQGSGRFGNGTQVFTHFYRYPGATINYVGYPRVKIMDNWGFCSNTALGGEPTAREKSCSNALGKDYWVKFNGTIHLEE